MKTGSDNNLLSTIQELQEVKAKLELSSGGSLEDNSEDLLIATRRLMHIVNEWQREPLDQQSNISSSIPSEELKSAISDTLLAIKNVADKINIDFSELINLSRTR